MKLQQAFHQVPLTGLLITNGCFCPLTTLSFPAELDLTTVDVEAGTIRLEGNNESLAPEGQQLLVNCRGKYSVKYSLCVELESTAILYLQAKGDICYPVAQSRTKSRGVLSYENIMELEAGDRLGIVAIKSLNLTPESSITLIVKQLT